MDERGWLSARFEENRPRLRGVAYRTPGSLSEAEDAVQEAWLRLHRTDTARVENLGGWLTTVVSRVCLDVLRAQATSRASSPCSIRTPSFASTPRHASTPRSRRPACREKSGVPRRGRSK